VKDAREPVALERPERICLDLTHGIGQNSKDLVWLCLTLGAVRLKELGADFELSCHTMVHCSDGVVFDTKYGHSAFGWKGDLVVTEESRADTRTTKEYLDARWGQAAAESNEHLSICSKGVGPASECSVCRDAANGGHR
jgi:hypothetical protein